MPRFSGPSARPELQPQCLLEEEALGCPAIPTAPTEAVPAQGKRGVLKHWEAPRIAALQQLLGCLERVSAVKHHSF